MGQVLSINVLILLQPCLFHHHFNLVADLSLVAESFRAISHLVQVQFLKDCRNRMLHLCTCVASVDAGTLKRMGLEGAAATYTCVC